MLWQWHQLSQSLWLLSRSSETLEATTPLSTGSLERERLSLGIPLLLLAPLGSPDAESSRQASGIAEPVAVEPEQAAESGEGPQLDQQVP